MKAKEAAEENYKKYSDKRIDANDFKEAMIGSFIEGVKWKEQRAIEVYRNLCPSYKINTRYDCGDRAHRHEYKTVKCDMNCEYMRKFQEKI